MEISELHNYAYKVKIFETGLNTEFYSQLVFPQMSVFPTQFHFPPHSLASPHPKVTCENGFQQITINSYIVNTNGKTEVFVRELLYHKNFIIMYPYSK